MAEEDIINSESILNRLYNSIKIRKKYFVVITTLSFVYILPLSASFYIVSGVFLIQISFRLLFLKYLNYNNVISTKKWALDFSIGAIIGVLSPAIPKNELWLTVTALLFFVIDKLELFPIRKINFSKSENYELVKNIIIGLYILFIIHIFYFAYRILPFAILYYSGVTIKL